MSGDSPKRPEEINQAAPVELNRGALEAIYAHAKEGYPEEVCGFLVAIDREGRFVEAEARRCENRQNALHAEDPKVFPRDARTAYNLGPKDLFFLDRSLFSERRVMAIYHSHVDVGAYFSDEDARAAAPDGELLYPVDYLVIDVQKDGVRGARLFRFCSGTFVEVGAYGP
jgi:adenylyltransferase/sulfurtransferase